MADADGLYYETHGSADAPVLILSPGLAGSATHWRSNIPALAEHFQVIAYDHRGIGRSDREPPGPTSVEAMAQDVIALMDALGINHVHFMGHALGGLIGLALAMHAPDRVGRLAVVNGWGQLDPYTARCFDVHLALLRDSGPEAYLQAQPIFLYPPAWTSANHQRLEAEANEDLVQFPGRATVEKRIAALRDWHPGPALAEIELPVLVFATADDALVPSHVSRGLCDLLPQGRRMVLPSGGHACNITEPEQFAANVLPWLRSEDEGREI
ncbi:MAG: pyrimidine utilization protein D [Sphingobium sp.]|nr:pyrimidine utilization protein D [Sphingobium sp.]